MRSLRVADASEVRLGLEVKLDQSQESELHNPGRQVEVASRKPGWKVKHNPRSKDTALERSFAVKGVKVGLKQLIPAGKWYLFPSPQVRLAASVTKNDTVTALWDEQKRTGSVGGSYKLGKSKVMGEVSSSDKKVALESHQFNNDVLTGFGVGFSEKKGKEAFVRAKVPGVDGLSARLLVGDSARKVEAGYKTSVQG